MSTRCCPLKVLTDTHLRPWCVCVVVVCVGGGYRHTGICRQASKRAGRQEGRQVSKGASVLVYVCVFGGGG
jgi:hypothetical protein